MARRTDNIHKRKDGRWEGRYKVGNTVDGKTKYRSIYGKTYMEVKSKMYDISIMTSSAHTNRRELKMCELLSLWFNANSIKHKGSTENKYLWTIEKHIIPELGNLKLSQITSAVINDYLKRKLTSGRLDNKGGLSASTVKGILIIINAALKYGVAEELCLPLKTPVYKPPQPKKQIKILDKAEQQMMENKITENVSVTELGILISLHTGLRIGEICALQWRDIDFENRMIYVQHTLSRIRSKNGERKTAYILDEPKTKNSKRSVPINSFLLPILEIAKTHSLSPFLVSNNETFINPRTYEYRYHKVIKGCGIGKINYHALRHTFATRCIESGCDYKTLSEILGHSSVKITMDIYVHSSIELKRNEIEKLVG